MLYSKDYRDADIQPWSIVYCDPPYKWTAEYSESWFNHKEFREYIRILSKTNKVFVSEYDAPEDFVSIYSFSQKSTLAWWNQKHNNQPKEKLFVHNTIIKK